MTTVAHFSEITPRIIEVLRRYNGAHVCSAWLTSEPIVSQLEEMLEVEIIVGDAERFVHGSHMYREQWTQRLLRSFEDRLYIYTSPVRMMHHKFIVLFRNEQPHAVITGSFNLTTSATRNFENIIISTDVALAQAYEAEFVRVRSESRSLISYY